VREFTKRTIRLRYSRSHSSWLEFTRRKISRGWRRKKRMLMYHDSDHTTWARKQKINMSGVGGSLRCSQTQILHTVVIPTEKWMKSLSLSAATTRGHYYNDLQAGRHFNLS